MMMPVANKWFIYLQEKQFLLCGMSKLICKFIDVENIKMKRIKFQHDLWVQDSKP